MIAHYLEDLIPGRVFRGPSHTMSANEIIEFAGRYDPQVFHLDAEAAKDTFFGGLAASGWHTASVTMRLLVSGELRLAWGIIGGGGEELRWHRPVRPGDVLSVDAEVLEARPSRSKPGQGMAKFRVVTRDAAGLPVQTLITSLVVPLRPAEGKAD